MRLPLRPSGPTCQWYRDQYLAWTLKRVAVISCTRSVLLLWHKWHSLTSMTWEIDTNDDDDDVYEEFNECHGFNSNTKNNSNTNISISITMAFINHSLICCIASSVFLFLATFIQLLKIFWCFLYATLKKFSISVFRVQTLILLKSQKVHPDITNFSFIVLL